MPLLRLSIIILMLFNLLALAAGQGWLGTSETRGEPERLTNQINPDGITLKPAQPHTEFTASAPKPTNKPTTPVLSNSVPNKQEHHADATLSPPAPAVQDIPPATVPPPKDIARADTVSDEPVCYAYTLPQPLADELEKMARTASSNINIRRKTVEPANTWWVSIPPFKSRQSAENRMRELRELGITDLFVVREPGPNQNAISLGLFRTESSARQHQSDLALKRIRDTDITPRNPAIQRLEIRGSNTVLTPLSNRISADYPLINHSPCPQT